MTTAKRSIFSRIFIAMMIFCGLVWVWTVAFILSWPWEKGDKAQWKPVFHLAAVCADNEPCAVAYGDLADAKASGRVKSLKPVEAVGEYMEPDAWLRWQVVSDKDWQIESKSSSWYFQTTVHYRLDENETPILVEYQDVGVKALYYGIAGGLFSLIGLYLRRLRS